MPKEMTPEQMKQWMVQWRSAEVALYEQKFIELQALTDEEAGRIATEIMWWTPELEYWLQFGRARLIAA